MTQQQIKLMLGILKIKETYSTLKELDFSDCVLNQLYDIIDDLEGLIEDNNISEIVKETNNYVN